MNSSRVMQIDQAAGVRRLHLDCGHSLKRPVPRRVDSRLVAVGDFVTCAACQVKSPLAEIGITRNQALGRSSGPRDVMPRGHCNLGPGRHGR